MLGAHVNRPTTRYEPAKDSNSEFVASSLVNSSFPILIARVCAGNAPVDVHVHVLDEPAVTDCGPTRMGCDGVAIE